VIDTTELHDLPDNLHDAALAYSRAGLRVIRLYGINPNTLKCFCGAQDCGTTSGKHPDINQWPEKATCESTQIDEWWTKKPLSNIGLPMGGLDRLIALDIDGAIGRASLAALESQHAELPSTLASQSGRMDGGEHRVFQVPQHQDLAAIRNSASSIAPGLDIRCEGGQIAVAPSRHYTGGHYKWITIAPPADLPQWLYDTITAESEQPVPSCPPVFASPDQHSEKRRAAYAEAALSKACESIRSAPNGERNITFNKQALGIARLAFGGVIDGHSAQQDLTQAALDVGLTKTETKATLRSAWRKGEQDPRQMPPSDRLSYSNGHTNNGSNGHANGHAASAAQTQPASERLTIEQIVNAAHAQPPSAFGDDVLAFAADLLLNQISEYERLTASLKEVGVRRQPWESAVKKLAGQLSRVARAAGEPEWHSQLLTTTNGQTKAAIANAIIALSNDPRWQDVLAYNLHSHQVEWRSPPPWPASDHESQPVGIWTERCDTLLLVQLETDLNTSLTPSQVRAAVETVARRASFHPIRDYLEACEPHTAVSLDNWLTTYLGAVSQPPEYLAAVGRWILISAVARAMAPGCKADNMCILEGGQGDQKSTAIRVLGSPWTVEIDAALLGTNGRDIYETMKRGWINEAAEIDSLAGNEMVRCKANISRLEDNYRAAYRRDVECVPRGWIAIGTTNATEYLRDTTGNRRFWPVRCGRIDIPGLTRDRSALWAEALRLYRSGAKWWPDKEDSQQLEQEQESRRSEDSWEPLIQDWLKTQLTFTDIHNMGVTVGEVLEGLKMLDRSKWQRRDEMRVAHCLIRCGWSKQGSRRRAGTDSRVWFPPTREPGEDG
jgi:predicted P-loop ATPase